MLPRCCCVGSDLAVAVALWFLGNILSMVKKKGLVLRRGFFCDDESIRLPYIESTVPAYALEIMNIGFPAVAFILGNIYEQYVHKREEKKSPAKLGRCRIAPWMLRLGFQLRWALIGGLLTVAVTSILKLAVGRLRPNFIAVCDPDFSRINCTDEYNHPVYVTDYECRGSPDDAISSRVSWPSGHSSISAYTFVLTALYFASVRSFYHRSGLKLSLISLLLMLSLLTSLSRISDHMHHPTDVLSGYVLGTLIAILIVYYNAYYFGHYKERSLYATAEAVSENQLIENGTLHQDSGQEEESLAALLHKTENATESTDCVTKEP